MRPCGTCWNGAPDGRRPWRAGRGRRVLGCCGPGSGGGSVPGGRRNRSRPQGGVDSAPEAGPAAALAGSGRVAAAWSRGTAGKSRPQRGPARRAPARRPPPFGPKNPLRPPRSRLHLQLFQLQVRRRMPLAAPLASPPGVSRGGRSGRSRFGFDGRPAVLPVPRPAIFIHGKNQRLPARWAGSQASRQGGGATRPGARAGAGTVDQRPADGLN